VLGCTGSEVLRQAAGNLTSQWFRQWPMEAALEEVAKKHIKFIVNQNTACSSHIAFLHALFF
jgi:UDP-N-acetylenolpyruvoylglucosamine reductase